MNVEQWLNLSSKKQQAYIELGTRFSPFYFKKLWLDAWEETHERRLVDEIYRVQPKILIKQKQKYNLRFVLMYDPNRLEDI